MSRRDDLRKQIDNHRRRLQKLEEQQALYGLDTPPHVLIEIEDIKAKIEELRAELKALEDGGIEAESKIHPFELAEDAKPKQRAQIFLQGDFSLLSDDRQSAAIAAFAAVMGISSQEIEVYRVYEGSIVFDLGIPLNAIHRLRSLLQSNSGQLHLLKVEKVILERESGEIEEWTIKEGKFELVTPSRRVTSLPSAQKQSALLRILKATTTLPAQVTLYASSLGAIALAAGADLPPVLAAVAGGVGVNALSNILERVARGEAVSDEEIRQQVQSAIDQSGIDRLLTEEEFQRGVARLHHWQASVAYAIDQHETAVAERLAQQSREHAAMTDELRQLHARLSAELPQLATRQQADEILSLLKYGLKEEDVKLASSPEKSNRKQLSPAEQYQIALHWAENGRRESLYGFDLSSCVLWGADLERADLRMANLRNADLGRANLQKANLGGADLRGANLFDTFLHGAKIDDTTQIDDKGRLILEIIQVSGGARGRNLRGVDLSNTILVWGELSEADLTGANLNRSTLSAAKLRDADLTNANLSEADLSMADLHRANLRGADLKKANIRQADLSEADLRGADLSETDLEDDPAVDIIFPGNLTGAKYNSSTIWPDNFDPKQWGAVIQD
jgi:uncharacterized protein YjbI with pentapeptide repeats